MQESNRESREVKVFCIFPLLSVDNSINIYVHIYSHFRKKRDFISLYPQFIPPFLIYVFILFSLFSLPVFFLFLSSFPFSSVFIFRSFSLYHALLFFLLFSFHSYFVFFSLPFFVREAWTGLKDFSHLTYPSPIAKSCYQYRLEFFLLLQGLQELSQETFFF